MKFSDALTALWEQVEQHLLLRWTLANIAGWSLGLLLGSFVAGLAGKLLGNLFGALIGLPLAGALAGGLVGAAQREALIGSFDESTIPTQWLTMSAIGGSIGAASLLLTWAVLFTGAPGFAIIGGVFGLAFGWMQARLLAFNFGTLAMWWVVANGVGGGLCSLLTFTGFPLPFALPICCTFGPVAFGLITGAVVRAIEREAIGGNHDD